MEYIEMFRMLQGSQTQFQKYILEIFADLSKLFKGGREWDLSIVERSCRVCECIIPQEEKFLSSMNTGKFICMTCFNDRLKRNLTEEHIKNIKDEIKIEDKIEWITRAHFVNN